MRRLRNLLDGLPASARCRSERPDEPAWGFVEELLAQVVEEVSVLTADRRRKEPRTIPRPYAAPASAGAVPSPTEPARPRHGGLLEAAIGRGVIRGG